MSGLEDSWTETDDTTVERDRPRGALLTFAGGAALMVVAVTLGNALQPEIMQLGLDGYLGQYGPSAWLRFLSFALGFPLGAGLCALAALLSSERSMSRKAGFAAWVILVTLAAVVVPSLFGRQPGPVFFAVGGYLLLGLLILALWFWGRYRVGLTESLRAAADLQAAGYLCFAAVSWNLCGLATMPSFALAPEQMIALGTEGFAAGQTKTIMALLILGWALVAWGYREAARKSSPTQT